MDQYMAVSHYFSRKGANIMDRLPKLYERIKLSDGRDATVVDFIEDTIIVDTYDDNRECITIPVMKSADMYIVCEDEGKIYNLCRRKGVRLQVIKDKEYCFTLGDNFGGEWFCFNKQQMKWACSLLNIDESNMVTSWAKHFEYNNFTSFLNVYRIVTAEEFYYVYGYDEIEKTADALYRFEDGHFERYFPRESIWREMPEQRMILFDKKPKYSIVTKTQGLSLALLV